MRGASATNGYDRKLRRSNLLPYEENQIGMKKP